MDSVSNHHINIYLPVRGIQTALLTIPKGDIRRLCTFPFKWLRFVMFSICGAYGHISATPGGPPLDYESTSLDSNHYYYNPSGPYAFVDPYALDDRETDTTQTPHGFTLGRNVIERDGEVCIVTGRPAVICDAAHIIPRSKGTEYIKMVIKDRSRCYSTPPPSISDIDTVENAFLLCKSVHAEFGHGFVSFLKTPNFAMNCTDIPRIGRVPAHADSVIVLHRLCEPNDYDPSQAQRLLDWEDPPRPSMAYSAGLHVDALFPQKTDGPPLPPAIILDFMYGVAAYKLWSSESLHAVVNDYFVKHYQHILPPQSHDQARDDVDAHAGDTADGSSSGCHLSPKAKQKVKARGMCLSEKRDVLADTMDEMNLVMMFLCGVTPEEAAKRWENQREEEERMAQEASRAKVMEWRTAIGCL